VVWCVRAVCPDTGPYLGPVTGPYLGLAAGPYLGPATGPYLGPATGPYLGLVLYSLDRVLVVLEGAGLVQCLASVLEGVGVEYWHMCV
jgi:hypothetical protein